MNGIEKKIDKLGRVVLPIKFRKRLGIELEDHVLVSLENESIIISSVNSRCVMCGGEICLEDYSARVCYDCYKKLKFYYDKE